MTEVPWFVPGMAIAFALMPLMAPWVGRVLRTPVIIAGLLVVSVGMVLAATLTPLVAAEPAPGIRGACDMTAPVPPPRSVLLALNDRSLNVLLFLPLGLAVALLPRSPRTVGVWCAAFLASLFIEGTQLALPTLGRGCEIADVFDNLTGLALGIGLVTAVRVAGVIVRAPR
jgi:VanZ family protein